ncbi:WD40/YVTN/BNR-like repeat-containing protein [Variovorax saccharolyticus]|uniref:WD40/YVTN/BNR-like repeat-containing protein n=1 Tax=Variovorax saccharolyticus TaxID=3053516 RepID=UPI0025763499|nr:YCF48-related protein [Variovorax sp. J31P216]MDM0028227.1 YCF48-related protein [Variovorax sp. J31P216]
MHRRGLLLATLGSLASAAVPGAEVTPRPAQPSALAAQRLVTGIARGGDRLVAVGQRGHVLRSGDGGRTWAQALVPVSVDLTAVAFVDADTGWATGHDGTVLGTRDGGQRWQLLLDGRQANALVLAHMRARVAASDASEQDLKLLEEARRNAEAGPDKPFLDLVFTDAVNGFVVGAYGLVMQTRDGGQRWTPWFDRVDNPGLLNLHAICASRGALYAAGEGGLLLKREPDGARFHALASPYPGSFFGIVATGAGVLAFGMRGHAFLSADEGRSWQPVATGLPASIVSGAVAADGTVVLADQAGNLVRSADGGLHFTASGLKPAMPLAAVAFADPRTLVLGGPRGLRSLAFTTKDS